MCRVMCLHVLLLSTFDLHNALYFGSLIFCLLLFGGFLSREIIVLEHQHLFCHFLIGVQGETLHF